MPTPSIGVAVITHCAKQHLKQCLPPYLNSPLNPRVLVVNSSSSDGTVELAQEMGAETLVIPREEFNHGSTREKARHHLATDIVVMVTPDAYPVDEHLLTHLTAPLIQKKAAVSYARQLPHKGADLFEAFPRLYNYPETSHTRSLKDLSRFGVYTFFCSDSCAAYSNEALDQIGGFRSVLVGEDTLATAMLLHQGHRIAYVAEAHIHHSHRYTIGQEFRRYFDTGLARRHYQSLIETGKSDESRGSDFALKFVHLIFKKQPFKLPYALLHTAGKWLGYRLGRSCYHAPLWVKKRLTSQDFFWVSQDFQSHAFSPLSLP